MKELSTFDKIEAVLYKGRSEIDTLTDRELRTKERWMLCVTKLMDDPITSDKDLISFLMAGCGGTCEAVSMATAYRDIAAVKRLVGNISLSSKNWYRHLIIESCKLGLRIAIDANDAKGIAANADKIGKYTLADKDDTDIDRSGWEPPIFEPSDDLTLLGDGFVMVEDLEEKRRAFRALFKRESVDAHILEDDGDEDG